MKKIIIFIFIVIGSQAFAQVPGYQGKRFILSYNPVFLTDISVPYVTNTVEYGISVHVHHNIGAEYVLGRKFSIGANVTFAGDNPDLYYTDLNTHSNMAFQSTALGFMLRFYGGKKSPLAPVGGYFQLKATTNSYTASQIQTNYYVDPVNGGYYKTEKLTGKGQTLGLGLGYGYNHVIYNRVVLSTGFDFELNLDQTPQGQKNDITNSAYSYILYENLFTFRIGIGGLLF